jgi:hypothetical protein
VIELSWFFVYSIVSFTVFFLIGRFMGKISGRREERLKKPEPITPTCPCTHTSGEHNEGGSCEAQIRRPHYNTFGDRSGHEYVVCACTKYHGPVVISSDFFNPGTYVP